MMNLNWKYYVIGFLVLIIIGGFIYHKMTVSDVTQLKLDHKQEIKEIKQEERDRAAQEIKDVTSEANDKIDSLLNLDAKIKYLPYEKRIYLDRSLDSALYLLPRARKRLLQ